MTALTPQASQNQMIEWDREKIELLKNTVCKGASDSEFEVFLHACKRTGLDPFMKQIYSVPRGGQRTLQTGIDGFRLIAERTGCYCPGKSSTYTYDKDGRLESATAYVKKLTKDGTWHEVEATADFKEYDGNNNMWKKFPKTMLAKVAESIALRKAFPADLSGVYSSEEMSQAEEVHDVKPVMLKISKAQEAELLKVIGDDKQYLNRMLTHYKVSRVTEIGAEVYDTLLSYAKTHAAAKLEDAKMVQDEAVEIEEMV